ncbi:MAG: SRPBCC family protein [Bacteroidia bacterium]
MEQKTQLIASDQQPEIFITRLFDIPLELLFKAYTEPDLLEQWMGTKVLQLSNLVFGFFEFETTDPAGNKHFFKGCIHEFEQDKKITRTFEIVNTGFPVQLEFIEFIAINEFQSELKMHIVYKSLDVRNKVLKMPFAFGLNMAHNRLENLLKN